jgi:histidyl-tRNA synthetase
LTDAAPLVIDSLCEECREHFDTVTRGLSQIGAIVEIDNRLVRGLDYYTQTAYEIWAGELGAQNAVCGGGRYDNLAEAIGGPNVPGVGFASGIERIVITMEGQGVCPGEAPKIDIYVIAAAPEAAFEVAKLTHELRAAGLSADMDYAGRSVKTQMKYASAVGAGWVCIIGGDELASDVVVLKDMTGGNQEPIARGAVVSKIIGERAGKR